MTDDLDAARAIVMHWRNHVVVPISADLATGTLLDLIAAALRKRERKVWEEAQHQAFFYGENQMMDWCRQQAQEGR